MRFLWVRILGVPWTGSQSSGSLMKSQCRYQGCSYLKVWWWLKDPLPRWLTNDWPVVTDSLTSGMSPFNVELSRKLLKCPHDMTAEFLQWLIQKNEAEETLSFTTYPKLPTVTSTIVHRSHKTNLVWYGRGLYKVLNIRSEGYLEGWLPHP